MSPFRTQFDYSTYSGFTPPVDDEPSIQAMVPVSESKSAHPVKRQWWSRMRRSQPDHPAADAGESDEASRSAMSGRSSLPEHA
jgi:hypothetical protein